MVALFPFHQHLFSPNASQIDRQIHFNNPRRQNRVRIRCCRDKLGESKNYYELLGVSVESSPKEIKDAYRKLQKKHHPDIAGEKGHESTLMLNKAYRVLMRDDLRKSYDASIGRISGVGVGRGALGSTWKGPLRPQALFVDENACVGCRECVHHAGNTFMMDEAFGTARVKVQDGDDDATIEVSVQGHESTLMLNKAYRVLMRDDLRKSYDASIGRISGVGVGRGALGSTWKGPLRPQALFVDENACVGCRECVHHAGNTFMMDEAFGTARVKVQDGDDDATIEVSVDSCPVNCIHWVETDELAVLEYLIQPQPKTGHGVYGQGWERPTNVFMAAKSFNRQLRQHETKQQKYEDGSTDEKETPAQAQARESAYMELKMGSFAEIWSWMKNITGK